MIAGRAAADVIRDHHQAVVREQSATADAQWVRLRIGSPALEWREWDAAERRALTLIEELAAWEEAWYGAPVTRNSSGILVERRVGQPSRIRWRRTATLLSTTRAAGHPDALNSWKRAISWLFYDAE